MRAGRYLELLTSQLEHILGAGTLAVRSPEFIPNRHTGHLVEVDVTLRGRIGSTDVLVALECRDRRKRQDVNWIRELATKRDDIGASAMVAVSSGGFTKDAVAEAAARGVVLKTLSRLSEGEIAGTILGLQIGVLRARYLVTGIARVTYRPFMIDPHQPPPPLQQKDLNLLSAEPSKPRLYDEKDKSWVSFSDFLGRAEWEPAFRDVEVGQKVTREVSVPCTYATPWRSDDERYRLFQTPDSGAAFSSMMVVADVWYEPEPAQLSAVFDYSAADHRIGRVAEVSMAPLGRPDDVLQVFVISPEPEIDAD